MPETTETLLLWTDLETTGLREDSAILEIAAILTDTQLNEKGRAGVVIHHDERVLADMDAWCQKTHGDNGLVEDVRASKTETWEAEQHIHSFLDTYTEGNENLILAGTSVHFDRDRLKRWMPGLECRLHYRNFDVRVLQQAQAWWMESGRDWPNLPEIHRAMPDIEHSLAVAGWYKERLALRPLASV